jgi:membrane protein YfhO
VAPTEKEVLQNSKWQDKTSDCLALLLLVAMLVSFCDEMIFSGKIPFFRDLAAYFYPIKFSVAESFKAGQLPLWEPRMAAGFPILAEFQSAVFYPPSVVFYIMPFFAAIQFSYVFHYAVAASGSYVLLRSWKQPIFVALIGSMLFSFGGTMVSLTNLLNHFQSAVWLPWLVYCWERAVENKRWSALVVFSIIAVCQLLAGSPEIFAFSAALLVADIVRMYCKGQSGVFSSSLARLSAAALMIIGIAMVQLLPTAELILLSRRDHAIPAAEAFAWSLPPSALIGLLLPMLEPDTSLSVGVRLLFTDKLPLFLSNYIGNIAVFGFSSWLITAAVKERLIVTGIIIISLLCAFGSYTPVYPELYKWLPGFHSIRFPEKFYYITFALLLFGTIRGITALIDGTHFSRTRMILLGVPAGWLVIYLVVRSNSNLFAHWIHPLQPPQTTINPATIAAILFSIEKQIAISVILAGVFLLHHLELLRAGLLQVLLVLVVFVDLSVANKPLHFLREKNTIQDAPRILEKPPPHGRIFYYPPGNNLHPSFVSVTGQPSYEKGTEVALNNLLPNAGLMYGFEYFQDIDALGRRSYTDFLNFINASAADERGKLLRALNVKYVVAFHSLNVKGINFIHEFPEHYSRLYEVTDSMPRTYLAAHPVYDPDPIGTLRRLSSDAFDSAREVVVDAPIRLEGQLEFRGDSKIELYQNRLVRINARLNEPGILVLTDAFYPGWKVYVDKHPQRILRANYLFRGVELTPGNHIVEFVYDPASFKIGLLISLMTVALVLATPVCIRLWHGHGMIVPQGAPAEIHVAVSPDAQVTRGSMC